MVQTEGPGWRLARDSSKKTFPILIGGQGWAMELRESEWSALAALVFELIDQKRDKTTLTYFEFATLSAFYLFSKAIVFFGT